MDLAHESDEGLMAAVKQGDRSAYDALYARWKVPIFRFLHRRTGTRLAAEDAHQETWIRVYRFRANFQPGRSFKSWLFAIAANCGHDAWLPTSHESGFDPELRLTTAPGDPTDRRLRLLQGLSRLDPDDRKLLLLAIEGFDGPEIGSLLGIGAGAVRMRLSRARERIRQALDDGGSDA
jgi:RNA polymerase sigma factor (sigma-70 family)